jgi:hypothetical protein
MKTLEMTGAALDWAVAQIEKPRLSQSFARKNAIVLTHGGLYTPSTNWAQGGPIIEREEIDTVKVGVKQWRGRIEAGNPVSGYGPTPLIAAMRCYVASKLGNEIEIPKELE